MINESLLQSCGVYHSKTIFETDTRPQKTLEQKTRVFIDNTEGKRRLAHFGSKMPVFTNHSRFLPRNLVYTKTDGTAWSVKVSFSHVVFIIPRPSLKRTHDHKERWNTKPAILQTTKKGCTTREALTQSQRVQACRGQRVVRRLAAT